MSDLKKLLGQRIKEIRKKRQITQEKLAQMVGIELPNMSYIETGRFYPSPETLRKLQSHSMLKYMSCTNLIILDRLMN